MKSASSLNPAWKLLFLVAVFVVVLAGLALVRYHANVAPRVLPDSSSGESSVDGSVGTVRSRLETAEAAPRKAPAVPVAHRGFTAFRDPDIISTGTLIGKVVDKDGEPVGGAVVTAAYGLRDKSEVTTDTISGADGLFRFDGLEAARFTITASAEGYAKVPPGEFTGTFPRLSDELLVVTMYDPQTLTGRVVDLETSAPVEGTTVSITLQFAEDRKTNFQSPTGAEYGDTLTDANGVFTFNNLRPGYANLAVRHTDYALQMPVFIPTDSTTSVITLDHGGSVRGALVGPDGPVAGAGVVLESPSCGGTPTVNTSAITDSTGLFEVSNLPYLVCGGRLHYSMYFTTSGLELPHYTFVLSEQRRHRDFIFQPSDMDRAEKSGEEMVVDLDADLTSAESDDLSTGTAVLSGTILLSYPPGPERVEVLLTGSGRVRHQKADKNLQFLFEKLDPGKYTLKTYSTNQTHNYEIIQPVEVQLKEGERREVTLRPTGGGLEGTLTGTSQGLKYSVNVLPIETSGSLQDRHGRAGASVSVSEQNTFSMTGLSKGSYRVTVIGSNVRDVGSFFYELGGRGTCAEAEFNSDGITTHSLTLHLEPNAVTGMVVDAVSGDPLPGLLVTCRSVSTWGGAQVSGYTVVTDKEGKFSFDAVDSGMLTVKINDNTWRAFKNVIPSDKGTGADDALGDQYPHKHISANITEPETDLGKTALRKSRGGILLRVEKPNKDPRNVFTCQLWPSESEPLQPGFLFDPSIHPIEVAEGVYLVSPLASGSYTVTCDLERAHRVEAIGFGRSVVRDIVVSRGTLTEVTVPQTEGMKTTLQLTAPKDTARLNGCAFWLRSPDQVVQPLWLNSEVAYDAVLSPGDYTFGVTLPDLQQHTVNFTVERSKEPIKVTLPMPWGGL